MTRLKCDHGTVRQRDAKETVIDSELVTIPLSIQCDIPRHLIVLEIPRDAVFPVLVPSNELVTHPSGIRRFGNGGTSRNDLYISDGLCTVHVVERDSIHVPRVKCDVLRKSGIVVVFVDEVLIQVPSNEIVVRGWTICGRDRASIIEVILFDGTEFGIDVCYDDIFMDLSWIVTTKSFVTPRAETDVNVITYVSVSLFNSDTLNAMVA